ncbi:hypothetical protein HYY69_00985 [Candidatus Woesearchaeota archaeon]|nr:hypothetical protein [Candidatus Woesearchaeota archaeon]
MTPAATLTEELTEALNGNDWVKTRQFFADKEEIRTAYFSLSEISNQKKSDDLANRRDHRKKKKQPFDLESLLKKAVQPRWKSPSDKKWEVLKAFYGARIYLPLPFIVVNHRAISNGSLERLTYLQERHGSEQTNHIVSTMPSVLGCSLSRTQGIYQFLDSRHTEEQTNHIVSTLPSVLGCSLSRTKGIYQFLDSRHTEEQTNHIVSTLPSVLGYSLSRTKGIYDEMNQKVSNGTQYIDRFPLILYCSVKLIKKKSLQEILDIVRKLEERVNRRQISMFTEDGYDITERAQYRAFIDGRYA